MMIEKFILSITKNWPFNRGRHFFFRNLEATGLLVNLSDYVGRMIPTRMGLKMRGIPRDRVSDWLKIFGQYELGTDKYLLRYKNTPGLFLDIGSNIGYYTMLLANANKDRRVWAFEPNPSPRECLEDSVEMNGFTERVMVFPFALSDKDGEADFIFQKGVSGSGHISKEKEGTIKVAIKNFQELWQRNDSPRIALLKIDVEGHEWQVLSGMEEMLKRDRPNIVVELVDAQLARGGSSSVQICDFLRGLGYEKTGSYELNSFFEFHG